MFGFNGFLQKPKKFNYTPRFYDPEKERREQRRRELLGADAVSPDDKTKTEYTPGQFIRESQMARRGYGRRASKDKAKRVSTAVSVGVLVLLLLLWYLMTR